MTRNNKHKSHRQSKHTKDDREHSVSDDGGKVKDKYRKDDVFVKTSRDSSSSEKRKHESHGKEDKEISVHANGDTIDIHNSKRRKERVEVSGSDRWNGGGSERANGGSVDKQSKMDNSRSMGSLEPNGKFSRRQDVGDDMDENTVEKDRIKSLKTDTTKQRSERSTNKDDHHSKDLKEKDNVVGSDKKAHDGRRALDEVKKGQRFQVASIIDERPTKCGGNTESTLPKDLRNLELEKELEKRTRRRSGGSGERDKVHDDVKDSSERRLSSRGDHDKDGRHKDELPRDVSEKNKIREGVDKDSRHQDEKHRRHIGKEKHHIDGKYRDECVRNDRYGDNYTAKSSKSEIDAAENRSKNSRKQSSRDKSPIYDSKRSRHKNDREQKRLDGKDDQSETRSHGIKEQRLDTDNRLNANKFDRESDRGRLRSRDGDMDVPSGNRRQKSSPTPSSNNMKDAPRLSNRSETSHKGSPYAGEASNICGAMEKASASLVKGGSAKVDKRESSAERCSSLDPKSRTDGCSQWVSGCKDNTGGDDDACRDGCHKHSSPSYSGRGHPLGTLKYLHPPLAVSRAGGDGGSMEGNRDKRCQGNSWRGVPNWSSAVANNFIPFPNGMPPVGFPPVLTPFATSVFGAKPNRAPFHPPDAERFSGHPRHFGWLNPVEWDAKGGVVADESCGFGRSDWDGMGGRGGGGGGGWDAADLWKRNESEQKGDWYPPQGKENVQSGQQQPLQAERNENISPAQVEKNASDASETRSEKNDTVLKNRPGGKVDISGFYFSRLEISDGLTEKDFYEQCSKQRGGINEPHMTHEEETVKVEANAQASSIPDVNDIVFERAISLYKKEMEERKAAAVLVVHALKKTEPEGEEEEGPTSTPPTKPDEALSEDVTVGGVLCGDVITKMPPRVTVGCNDSDIVSLCRIPLSQNTH